MRAVLRGLLRFAKWTFSLLLVLLLVAFVGGWFLLGTEKGYQYVPNLINRFTPFTLEYSDLRGQFFGQQYWQDLHLTGAGLDIRLHEAEMDFAWQDLFSRQVHIRSVRLEDGVVALPTGDDAPRESGAIPDALPQIRLPVGVQVDQLAIQAVDIQKEQKSIVYIENADVQAQYDREGKAHVEGEVALREGRAMLAADLTTVGDYPLQLKAEGQLTLPEQAPLDVAIQASGSVLKPTLAIRSQGLLAAEVDVQGDVGLAQQTLRAQGQWRNVAYGDVVAVQQGELRVDGTFSDWTVMLASDLSGKDIPPADIAVQGRVNVQGQSDFDAQVKMLDGDIALQGQMDAKQQTLSAQGQWRNVAYGDVVASKKGELHVDGTFSDWTVKLVSDVSGKDIPPADIAAQGRVNREQVRDLDVLVKMLGGAVALQGEAAWQDGLDWQAQLRIDDIDGRTFRKDLDLTLQGDIRTQGTLRGATLDAEMDIVGLNGHWQQQPIRGQGSVNIHDMRIDVRDFLLEVAGNQLEGHGTLGGADADLHVKLQADHLDRIVPMVRGKIAAQGTVKGNIVNPDLDVQATWQGLQVGDGIVQDSAGTLDAKGRWQDLALALDGQAKGRDFPALSAKGTSRLRFAGDEGRVDDIDLHVKTLEGDLQATGGVVFMPDVRWDVVAQAKGINPQTYVDGLKGKVDAKVVSSGSVIDGKLAMNTRLEDLGGQWQGQKLDGTGEVTIDNGKLAFKGMALAVGNNRVKLDGQMDGDALDVRFDVDAKSLADFYPDLRGAVQGKGTLKGKTAAPQVQADVQGKGLAFGDYRVEQADAKLDTQLQKGGALNNHIQLRNVQLAGQHWADVRLDSDGRFEAHTLQMRASGGEINGELTARGGLQDLSSWRGTMERLQVQGKGLEWALQKPSAVSFSKEAIDIKDFCLADAHSGLCLNLARAKTTELRYDIRKIDPQSFAAFIPKTLSIGTALSGSGHIRVDANGKMLGEANIVMAPGKIVIRPPKQAPIALDLREGKLESAFTVNEARSRLNVDFGDSGKVQGTMVVKDYRALNLDGRVQLDIPNIGRFAYLLPKVSEMQGNVKGDLLIGGNAAKPQVSGQITLDGGAVKIPEYATELRDIRLNLKAERSGQIDINGKIGTPEGHLDANGVLLLSPVKMDLKLAGERMLIANSKTMRVLISPKFDINIDPEAGVNIAGQVDVPEANIDIPDTSSGESISEDVIIVTDAQEGSGDVVAPPSSAPMRATIAVRLGDKVYFANKDMKIKLIGGLDIGIRPGQVVTGRGTIEVASGYYELYGQELNIQRGRANFSGNIANPSVEVLALRDVEDVSVGARVSGTAKNLRLDLTSEPAMPDSAILSYLLFGRAPDGAMDGEALMQTAAGIGLKGIFPGDLANEAGLDVFDVGVTGLKAGKYLTEDIYVGMRSNFFTGVTEFLARYQFNKRMSMEVSSEGGNTAVDFLYQFEKD